MRESREKESLREWKKLFIMRIFRWLAYISMCLWMKEEKRRRRDCEKFRYSRALGGKLHDVHTSLKINWTTCWRTMLFFATTQNRYRNVASPSRRYNNNEIISSSILLFTIFCIIIIWLVLWKTGSSHLIVDGCCMERKNMTCSETKGDRSITNLNS